MIQNNYQLLIQKLDEFIRKYYANKIIRGTIYTLSLLLFIYLAISIAEYYLYFSSGIRKILFYSFLIISFLSVSYWVFIPLLHFFRLGKIISHEQAAIIIGKHFTNIQDRLLNVLNLQKQSSSYENKALIEAGINQKIETLRPVPFTSAINFSGNKKYLKYAVIPVLVIIFLLVSAPNILQESNARLINNNRAFAPKAPFQFFVENNDMRAVQFEDFDLTIKVDGSALPNEVYAITENQRIKLNKIDNNTFEYTFKKLQQDVDFYLAAGGFNSVAHTIKVLPKPMIVNFSTTFDYPDYINKKDETIKNIGDMVIPAGTKVKWDFNARNTDNIGFQFKDSREEAKKTNRDIFSYERTLMNDGFYKIYIHNNNLRGGDSIGYNINVIPDKYPVITVDKFEDTLDRKYLFFAGEASDDYGMRNISFAYKITSKGQTEQGDFITKPVRAGGLERNAKFNYSWDLGQLNIKPGDEIKYYFIVWDNDGVNGSKYSKTPTMTFAMPTVDEFKEMNKQSNEDIKKDLEKTMKDAKKLNEEIEKLQEKLLQKKELSWEDKEAIQNLLEKQRNLQEKVKSTQQKYEQNLRQQNEYKKSEERIQEKQQKLQELFDDMMNEEMKRMMEEMEKLLDKLNQEKAMEELENFEMNNEQLEKELDRMLELFKKLEMEQKMEEIVNALNELAKEQDELKKETDQNKTDSEELSEKQEDINEKFEDLKEELSELDKMNEELQNKKDLEKNEEMKKEIEKNLEQSLDQLKQNQKKKSSGSQQKASEQMKQMAQKMQSQMQSMEMEQMMLDMRALQQLLDNLIKLSFDQEQLMDDLKEASINTPRYVELVQKQHKIKKDSRMVEDSLFALSKRVFQISSFVNKEIAEINSNMEKGIELLAERRKPEANARQQYVMTGMNNLALMLDEVLKMMQQQMSSSMMGSQMCNKPQPGQGMGELSKMQQQLNEQLKKMKGEMGKGGKGQGKMSKELAEMAARQAAIRKAMQEINKNQNKDGKGSLGDLEKLAEEMEKTEEEIVNKKLTQEMLERQQDIMVRLLEAAEAERQREISPERQSEVAEKISKKIPPSLEEYLKKREAEVDLYKTVPPTLKPFYKNIVEDYFKSISSHN